MPSLSLFSISDSESFIHDQTLEGEAFLEGLKYDSAEIILSGLMPVLEKNKDWKNYCKISNKYIISLWRQGKLSEAEQIARKTLGICKEQLGEEHPETIRCNINNGVICFLSGKPMSITYFRKAVILAERLYGDNHPLTAEAYEWLGCTHESANNAMHAYRYLKKSLQIWKNTKGNNHPDLGNIYRYFGLYYKRFGQLDSAMLCFNKSKKLFDLKYGKYNYKSVKCLNNICDVYEVIEQYDTTKIIYAYALDLLSKSEAPNRYIYMMTYFNLGELYQREGDFLKAIQFFQKTLPLYFPGFKAEDIYSNPEEIGEYPYQVIKMVLFWKARSFIELAKTDSTNQLKYLKAAYNCYSDASRVIDNIKYQLSNYADLLNHENSHANLMVELAENALEIYSLTDDALYFERALQYLEKNKQMVLFASSNTDHDEDNPSYGYEQKAGKLQARYNQLLNMSTLWDADNDLAYFNERQINIKIEMDQLKWEIEQVHHKHEYRTKETAGISLAQIRKTLQDDQVLIQFTEFCHDYISKPERILSLIITQNQIAYYTIDGEQAYNLIAEYYNLISNRNPTVKVDSIGHELYNLLLGHWENLIDGKDIIIIPSQHISLVAFDALPVSFVKEGRVAYLIEKHAVWKDFSISSFVNYKDDGKAEELKVLAMAPGFTKENKLQIAMLTKRDTSLINLAGAERECMEISGLLNTKLITGFEATEDIFKSLSSEFPLIHLSTHGVPCKFNEETVRLAFSKRNDTIEDGFLSMYEVFNLDLNAELVVISACKTGIGKLNKGEGNLNLGWAFSKAGAKSVVISLWDANDYASSKIMPVFYKLLADGHTKPSALHQAKLEFLTSSDDLTSNPYFWAGFEYYGNNQGIISKSKILPEYIWGIVLVCSLILAVIAAMGKKLFANKEHLDAR